MLLVSTLAVAELEAELWPDPEDALLDAFAFAFAPPYPFPNAVDFAFEAAFDPEEFVEII